MYEPAHYMIGGILLKNVYENAHQSQVWDEIAFPPHTVHHSLSCPKLELMTLAPKQCSQTRRSTQGHDLPGGAFASLDGHSGAL